MSGAASKAPASARGLFRATGNKTRKVVADIIDGDAVVTNPPFAPCNADRGQLFGGSP